MLRHYSTVRTSVVTVALPVCIGVLGWVLSANVQSGTAIVLLVAELGLIVYALLLSFHFSYRTALVRRFLMILEADTHREEGDPLANEGLLFSSVINQQLPVVPELDSIDRTLLVALSVLHIAFWIYYGFAVFPGGTAAPYKPTDQERAAVRAAVLASKDLCDSGRNQVLAIRDLQVPAPSVARVDVSCGSASGQFSPSTYLLEKQSGVWRLTAPRVTAPPAPPPPAGESKPKQKAKKTKTRRKPA